MDRVTAILATSNAGVIKEPKGFIKFLQFIIAIFAFATTCGFTGHTSFKVTCNHTITITDNITFSYPFKLSEGTSSKILVPVCGDGDKKPIHPYGSFSASAEFYVFVGVMAFLYCIGAVILYIFFDDYYRKNDRIPIADFIISGVLTVLWFIAACAWAAGIGQLKFYANPKHLFNFGITDCKLAWNKCEVVNSGNYAGLIVSIMFGFLNLFVWSGNLWFLYKETSWFKVKQKPVEQPIGGDLSGGGMGGGMGGGVVDPSQVQV